MVDTIQVIGAAMNRDLTHLSNVSHNVANTNTPGFLSTQSYDGASAYGDGIQLHTLQSFGGIRDTGKKLDLAIIGDAFFRVQQGEDILLTKNGQFHINPSGYLAHSSGALVLGEQGPIAVGDDNVAFKSNGVVVVGQSEVARLSIVSSSNISASDVGQGLYISHSSTQQASKFSVKSGSLNSANVNPSVESVRMMELSRHMQSLQKVVTAYDQMLNAGINELGKR